MEGLVLLMDFVLLKEQTLDKAPRPPKKAMDYSSSSEEVESSEEDEEEGEGGPSEGSRDTPGGRHPLCWGVEVIATQMQAQTILKKPHVAQQCCNLMVLARSKKRHQQIPPGKLSVPSNRGVELSMDTQLMVGLRQPTGSKGDRGMKGDTGVMGPPGAQGSKGDSGRPGPPEVHVSLLRREAPGVGVARPSANHHSLAVTTFLSGQPGLQGVPSPPGAVGHPGANGKPGSAGSPGLTGCPGSPGSPGAVGLKGSKGDTGGRSGLREAGGVLGTKCIDQAKLQRGVSLVLVEQRREITLPWRVAERSNKVMDVKPLAQCLARCRQQKMLSPLEDFKDSKEEKENQEFQVKGWLHFHPSE
ncbi:collagen alpha-1(XXIII) chain [Pongo abelii]|uniref:collagen alpha-1(XXIII) chain n=1 Tax=Pongo abelii TaxID=9601 RepID=UPI003006EF5F